MITINDELDFRQWFKDNHTQLGFEKIIKENFKGFPDFSVLENSKEIGVELETLSSNFKLHKHPILKNHKVVCVKEDIKLKLPTIVAEGLRMGRYVENKESEVSIKSKVWNFIKNSKEKVFTTSDIKKGLAINWATAERYLLELVIEGKIEKIKKEGVNLWVLK